MRNLLAKTSVAQSLDGGRLTGSLRSPYLTAYNTSRTMAVPRIGRLQNNIRRVYKPRWMSGKIVHISDAE